MHFEKQQEKQSSTVITNAKQVFVSNVDHVDIHYGSEPTNLLPKQQMRVSELQKSNEALASQIANHQKNLGNSRDPLTLLAEIEHFNVMIARNTGEILNIYTLNEQRLQRITELEALNLDLHQAMSDNQSEFITSHDSNFCTKHAAEYFTARAQCEKNSAEIELLKKD